MKADNKSEQFEVRGHVARYVIDVVDAVAMHQSAGVQRRVARFEVVRGILMAWADQKMREAALIGRLTGNGKP